MALLEVKNITKQLPGGLLIKHIGFEQNQLQKIAITGESGSGKTTVLKMISGNAQPDSGTILFNGKRVVGPEEKLLPGHKDIAYLSQHYELLNNYRVEELIWFENKLSEETATNIFKICRIHHLLKRSTGQLSGGEKQRIALCMLLVKQPKILVLDEPFSNLDLIHKDILKSVLNEITERLQITCLLTSHDPHDTLSWADEIIVMSEGQIIQQAAPETIYHHPINEFVAGIFGKYNLLNDEQAALFGIETNGKDIMLRPEQFNISTKKNNGLKGVIQTFSFWGSYYEAEVLVNDFKITVRTSTAYKINETVYVAVIKDLHQPPPSV